MTLEQIRDALDIQCHILAIYYCLKDMNYSYKKTLKTNEQDREDIKKT